MQYEDVPVVDFRQSLEPKKDYLIACLLKQELGQDLELFCKNEKETFFELKAIELKDWMQVF